MIRSRSAPSLTGLGGTTVVAAAQRGKPSAAAGLPSPASVTDFVGLEGVMHVSHWTMLECMQQAKFPPNVVNMMEGGGEDAYNFASCVASPPEPPARSEVVSAPPDGLRPVSYIDCGDSDRFHRLLASVRRGARARRGKGEDVGG